MASLVKIIIGHIEDHISRVFERLEDFLEAIESEKNIFFLLDFMTHDISSVSELVGEFRKFGDSKDLFKLFGQSLRETVRRQNKRILERLSVKICFKAPNLQLLEGYKKILKVRFIFATFAYNRSFIDRWNAQLNHIFII